MPSVRMRGKSAPVLTALYLLSLATMKKLIVFLSFLLLGSCSQGGLLEYEASMNFDLENVRPFLTELDAKFKFGLNINEMVAFAESVDVEDEKSLAVDISYEGQAFKMIFTVFMDDIEAPDLYFFLGQAELAEEIGGFMMEWAEARGM